MGKNLEKNIEEIEHDLIRPLLLRIESLDNQIQQVKKEEEKTRKDLSEVETQELNELNTFLQEKEDEVCIEIEASLPRREKRLTELLAAAFEEMTQIALDNDRISGHLRCKGTPIGLIARVFENLRALGYCPLNIEATGGGQWFLKAMTLPTPEFAKRTGGTNVIFLRELLTWQREGDKSRWIEQWKKEKGL